MWPAHMPRATTRRRGGTVLTNTTEIGTAILPLRSVTIPVLADVSPSAERLGLRPRLCTDRRRRRAGRVEDSGGLGGRKRAVRSRSRTGRQGAGRGKTEIECASEPDGLAAGAAALPGARRRCEAGKRTHGPGPRACLALLAAAALLALAAPAQAQTEVWSATLTPATLPPASSAAQRRLAPPRMQQHLRPLRTTTSLRLH